MVNLSQITDVNLRNAVQNIMTSISTDPQWQDYEVLNSALQQGKKDVANYFLDNNCAVKRPMKTPTDSPLHHAVKLADISLIAKLLDKGASVTSVNAESNSPLHLAFLLNHTEIVNLILTNIEQTVNYDDVANKQGLTHFHIACARGNAQVANDFEYSGADLLAIVSEDSPVYAIYDCLRFAYESKSIDTLEVVLRATGPLGSCVGNSPKTHSIALKLPNYGRSLIKMHHDGFSFSEDRKVQLSEFQKACFNGLIDKVKTLLDKVENVNEVMTQDADACPLYTPLHFAVLAEDNRKEVIELLLERGSNVDLKDGFIDGKRGANVNANEDDPRFNTPLLSAMTEGLGKVAQVLLENGANAKVVKKAGKKTVIHLLTEAIVDSRPTDFFDFMSIGECWLIEKMVKCGADIDAKDSEGHTALHIACFHMYGHWEVVEHLLMMGADITIKAKDRATAFDMAFRGKIRENYSDFIELYHHVQKLKDLGLPIDQRNEKYCEILMKKKNSWMKYDEDGRETIEDLFSEEKMEKKKEERQKEIEQLKQDMLTVNVSMYDYLRMTPQQAAVYSKNERIQFIVEDDESRVLYKIYGYLIPVMYRKSLKFSERPKKIAKRRLVRKSTD